MHTSDDASTDRAFTLRMPPDLGAALCEQAKQHERSAGAEMRHILRAHLDTDTAEPSGRGHVEEVGS